MMGTGVPEQASAAQTSTSVQMTVAPLSADLLGMEVSTMNFEIPVPVVDVTQVETRTRSQAQTESVNSLQFGDVTTGAAMESGGTQNIPERQAEGDAVRCYAADPDIHDGAV